MGAWMNSLAFVPYALLHGQCRSRYVKYCETIFDILTRQSELAKLDEANVTEKHAMRECWVAILLQERIQG